MLIHLFQRYECDADDCKIHDARGTKKHDVPPLALGSFRLIARHCVFDDLEELHGIRATANRAFFCSFVPWLAAGFVEQNLFILF
jgi:hypothetical protein